MTSHKFVLLLWLVLLILITADATVDDDGSETKKKNSIQDKETTIEDDNDDEIGDDLKNVFEKLSELKAFRDTMLKLVPGDALGDSKESKDGETDDDIHSEDKQAAELLKRSALLDVLTKEIGLVTLSSMQKSEEEEEVSDWEEEIEEEPVEEEVKQPLTLEQQEGVKIF